LIGVLDWHGQRLEVDFGRGQPLAIPLDPHGAQPSFFAEAAARSRPLESGDYVGSVARGGSCNAEVIEFAPHCHGTHTECIAHLIPGRGSVFHSIDRAPGPARLITLKGRPPGETGEDYQSNGDQPLLTRAELESSLPESFAESAQALIVRTLPNRPEKLHLDYSKAPPYPVFSDEAMQWLSAKRLMHLLVDTPSLDAAQDEGRLSNHRCWWGLAGPVAGHPEHRSVTEMIYVPDGIEDGLYWLHLGLQPLVADAAASDPVIYPLREADS